MPVPLDQHGPEELLTAERDIRVRLDGRPFDFEAMLAVSNIYRAATAVRNRMVRDVLGPEGLSWGGFTILFVLWVWGKRETGDLAEECGLAKGTLTGMLTTLEKAGLVARSPRPDDRRRVVVELLQPGAEKMERVFPRFNRKEVEFTSVLEPEEIGELARLLRRVAATASGAPLVADS